MKNTFGLCYNTAVTATIAWRVGPEYRDFGIYSWWLGKRNTTRNVKNPLVYNERQYISYHNNLLVFIINIRKTESRKSYERTWLGR